MSVAEHLTVVQYNVENGGLSDPIPGKPWDRTRLDGFIDFVRHQKTEHGMSVLLQQEGCFYDYDGSMLLHEIETATGLRGFMSPGERARKAGGKDHPPVVWVDPSRIQVLKHVEHSGGTWWHSAMQVQALLTGRAINLISAHLNVASPVLREGEGAALTMIGGLMIIGADANSAHATGPAQDMAMSDRKHHAHRAAGATRPEESDRAFAQYLEFAGFVEVHTHIGTDEAMRWTTGHRPKQVKQGGGSHADHAYVSGALADGAVARVTDCVVITGREYPGIEEISDHLPSRFALAFTAA